MGPKKRKTEVIKKENELKLSLSKVGIQLNEKTKTILQEDFVIIQQRFNAAVKSGICDSDNLLEYVKQCLGSVQQSKILLQQTTLVLETGNELQPSVVKLLTNNSQLQSSMLQLIGKQIFENDFKMSKIAKESKDYGELLEVCLLMLHNLRWLDNVVSHQALVDICSQLLSSLSTAALVCEVVTCLPDILDVSVQGEIVPSLLKLLPKSQFFGAILECLAMLTVDESTLTTVIFRALEVMKSSEPNQIPACINFLFSHITQENYTEVFETIRQSLSTSLTLHDTHASDSFQSTQSSRSSPPNVMSIFTTLHQAFSYRANIVDLLIKFYGKTITSTNIADLPILLSAFDVCFAAVTRRKLIKVIFHVFNLISSADRCLTFMERCICHSFGPVFVHYLKSSMAIAELLIVQTSKQRLVLLGKCFYYYLFMYLNGNSDSKVARDYGAPMQEISIKLCSFVNIGTSSALMSHALDVLQAIASSNGARSGFLNRSFIFFSSLLYNVELLDLKQTRKLYAVVCRLIDFDSTSPSGDPVNAELQIVLKKQMGSDDGRIRIRGAMGTLAVLETLLEHSLTSNGENNMAEASSSSGTPGDARFSKLVRHVQRKCATNAAPLVVFLDQLTNLIRTFGDSKFPGTSRDHSEGFVQFCQFINSFSQDIVDKFIVSQGSASSFRSSRGAVAASSDAFDVWQMSSPPGTSSDVDLAVLLPALRLTFTSETVLRRFDEGSRRAEELSAMAVTLPPSYEERNEEGAEVRLTSARELQAIVVAVNIQIEILNFTCEQETIQNKVDAKTKKKATKDRSERENFKTCVKERLQFIVDCLAMINRYLTETDAQLSDLLPLEFGAYLHNVDQKVKPASTGGFAKPSAPKKAKGSADNGCAEELIEAGESQSENNPERTQLTDTQYSVVVANSKKVGVTKSADVDLNTRFFRELSPYVLVQVLPILAASNSDSDKTAVGTTLLLRNFVWKCRHMLLDGNTAFFARLRQNESRGSCELLSTVLDIDRGSATAVFADDTLAASSRKSVFLASFVTPLIPVVAKHLETTLLSSAHGNLAHTDVSLLKIICETLKLVFSATVSSLGRGEVDEDSKTALFKTIVTIIAKRLPKLLQKNKEENDLIPSQSQVSVDFSSEDPLRKAMANLSQHVAQIKEKSFHQMVTKCSEYLKHVAVTVCERGESGRDVDASLIDLLTMLAALHNGYARCIGRDGTTKVICPPSCRPTSILTLLVVDTTDAVERQNLETVRKLISDLAAILLRKRWAKCEVPVGIGRKLICQQLEKTIWWGFEAAKQPDDFLEDAVDRLKAAAVATDDARTQEKEGASLVTQLDQEDRLVSMFNPALMSTWHTTLLRCVAYRAQTFAYPPGGALGAETIDRLVLRWRRWSEVVHGLVEILRQASTNRQKVAAAECLLGMLKYGKAFVDVFLKRAMPLIDVAFARTTAECKAVLDVVQKCTRFLQTLCDFAKSMQARRRRSWKTSAGFQSCLAKEVPAVKRTLETLLLRVKAMVDVNGCKEAFWVGNLKHVDLQGQEVLSQLVSTQSDSQQHQNVLGDDGEAVGEDDMELIDMALSSSSGDEDENSRPGDTEFTFAAPNSLDHSPEILTAAEPVGKARPRETRESFSTLL